MPQERIEWPQDKAGFLYKLKHAGMGACERQYGHEEKHKTLVATLEKLIEHAKARYEVQRTSRDRLRASLTGKPVSGGETTGEAEKPAQPPKVEPEKVSPAPTPAKPAQPTGGPV